MNFSCYTLGGTFFWEDVFFYQKWRIQRHYKTKKCRLLDNWDIKRHTGTFNQCYKAFLEFSEVFQIPKQKGDMIIMLPSFIESKNVFKPLWRQIIKKGYNVAAINYPSTLKNSKTHAVQINFLLDNLKDIKNISFIAKGAGVLVLDKILKSKNNWQKKIKVKNMVVINPPHQSHNIIKKILSFNIIKKILGPMAQEYINYKNKLKAETINLKRFNTHNINKIIKKL